MPPDSEEQKNGTNYTPIDNNHDTDREISDHKTGIEVSCLQWLSQVQCEDPTALATTALAMPAAFPRFVPKSSLHHTMKAVMESVSLAKKQYKRAKSSFRFEAKLD
jgi:hypothetical protein